MYDTASYILLLRIIKKKNVKRNMIFLNLFHKFIQVLDIYGVDNVVRWKKARNHLGDKRGKDIQTFAVRSLLFEFTTLWTSILRSAWQCVRTGSYLGIYKAVQAQSHNRKTIGRKEFVQTQFQQECRKWIQMPGSVQIVHKAFAHCRH